MNAIPAAACCPADACTTTTTTLYALIAQTTSGIREIYQGNGDPNGVTFPDVPSLPALYYNLDVPGELWVWVVAAQSWI